MKDYLMTFANRESAVQVMKVGIVGVFNTLVSFTLFNIFLAVGLSWFWSISVSFALTTFVSYLLNRRWTFALTNGHASAAETASFFGVNIAAYLASVGIMWTAEALVGPLDTVGYNIALLVAAGLLILPKLAGYRDIVFGRAIREGEKASPAEHQVV